MRYLLFIALLVSSSVQAAGAEITVKIKLPDNWECVVGRGDDDCDEDDDDQGEDEMNISLDPEPETYYDGNTQYTL